MSYPADSECIQRLPVFLYGSLRHSEENYTLLRGYTVHEEPARVEHMDLYAVGRQPVAIPGAHFVVGEIAAIKPLVYEQILSQLDAFENGLLEDNHFFQRRRCLATTADGSTHEAWIYTGESSLITAACARIASGDWVSYYQAQLQATRYGRYLNASAQARTPRTTKGPGTKPHASK